MSARKKYLEMFQSPFFKNNESMMSFVHQEIDALRRDFRNTDRITWLLKVLKYEIYHDNQDKLTSKEYQWCLKFEDMLINHEAADLKITREMSPRPLAEFTHDDYEGVRETLLHFVSLGVPKINDMVFGNANYEDLKIEMDGHELEWEETLQSRSVTREGLTLITFPDGSEIVDLETYRSEAEGVAMAHCGNNNGHPGQRMYSYRTVDPEDSTKMIPHVTFIVNNQDIGNTGEIKGYANNPPIPKYHDVIIAFLELDIIKKMSGGGYKPQNNFKTSDLPLEKEMALFEKKPELFNPYRTWKLSGEQCNETVKDVLKNSIGSLYMPSQDGSEDRITIFRGDGISELANTLEMKILELYSEDIEAGYILSNGINYRDSEDHIIKTLDSLIQKKDDSAYRMQAHLKNCYDDEITNHGIDITTGAGIMKLNDLVGDRLLDNIFGKMVVDSAYPYAIEKLMNSYHEAIQSIGNSSGIPGASLHQSSLSGEWRITIPVSTYFENWDEMIKNDSDEVKRVSILERILPEDVYYPVTRAAGFYKDLGEFKFLDVGEPEKVKGGWSHDLSLVSARDRISRTLSFVNNEEIESLKYKSEGLFDVSDKAQDKFASKKTNNNSLSM